MDINYVRRGSGTKKVLFIHGNMGSIRWWLPVMERMNAEMDMLAVDLRGYGSSPDGLPEVSMSDHARDIYGVAAKAGFDQFTVVGHSLGGAVAMQFAASYPERLTGMVLVDSAPVDGMKNIDYQRLEFMLGNPEVLVAALKMTMAVPVDEEYFRGLAADCLRSIPAVIPNTRALEQADFSRAAAGFIKPVLVMHGQRDMVIQPAEAEKTARAYPNAAMVVIDGCGHNPQVETPEAFVRNLCRFMSVNKEE